MGGRTALTATIPLTTGSCGSTHLPPTCFSSLSPSDVASTQLLYPFLSIWLVAAPCCSSQFSLVKSPSHTLPPSPPPSPVPRHVSPRPLRTAVVSTGGRCGHHLRLRVSASVSTAAPPPIPPPPVGYTTAGHRAVQGAHLRPRNRCTTRPGRGARGTALANKQSRATQRRRPRRRMANAGGCWGEWVGGGRANKPSPRLAVNPPTKFAGETRHGTNGTSQR